MSMPDLTAAPYELDADAIAWVRSTIDAMDENEKVGQLFINLNNRFDEDSSMRSSTPTTPGRRTTTRSARIQGAIRQARPIEGPTGWWPSNIEAGGKRAAPTAPVPRRCRPRHARNGRCREMGL